MVQGHHGVEGGGAEMVAVTDGHIGDPGLPGLADGDLHGPVADHLADAVVPVQKGGGHRLFLRREVHGGRHRASLQPGRVEGQAKNAVGIDAPQIRRHQRFGRDLGLLPRDTQLLENLGAEGLS